jgi:hypothetical protein
VVERASVVALDWKMADGMRFRMLMQDDLTMSVRFSLVHVLRRRKGNKSQGRRQSERKRAERQHCPNRMPSTVLPQLKRFDGAAEYFRNSSGTVPAGVS